MCCYDDEGISDPWPPALKAETGEAWYWGRFAGVLDFPSWLRGAWTEMLLLSKLWRDWLTGGWSLMNSSWGLRICVRKYDVCLVLSGVELIIWWSRIWDITLKLRWCVYSTTSGIASEWSGSFSCTLCLTPVWFIIEPMWSWGSIDLHPAGSVCREVLLLASNSAVFFDMNLVRFSSIF